MSIQPDEATVRSARNSHRAAFAAGFVTAAPFWVAGLAWFAYRVGFARRNPHQAQIVALPKRTRLEVVR